MAGGDKDTCITVLGTGYVGLTTAVMLAEAGYKVYAVEINPQRLKTLQAGRSFFYEEGLGNLIRHALQTNNLIATDSYKQSVPKSQFVFSCVGTPDNPDGSSNLGFVYKAAEDAAKFMREGTIYVQKSTVPVGTGFKIQDMFKKHKKRISYVSNPEFLREGTAISDTLWPDRIVAGSDKQLSAERVIELYKKIEDCAEEISARADISRGHEQHTDYFITTRNSAELIKVTANAFLALKISFANSIAKLSDQAGADVVEVMDAVGADSRIGRAFLSAGRGYGGGCFPKDVSGLISSANDYGVELGIMTAASDVNDSMPGYIANKAKEALGALKGKKVAVLGLAFKAGTSDARRSPGVSVANILAKEGAVVSAYDPRAKVEAKEELHRTIVLSDSWKAAVKEADAVFITTDWPEFSEIDLDNLKELMRGDLFVDAVNSFKKITVLKSDLTYLGVGR